MCNQGNEPPPAEIEWRLRDEPTFSLHRLCGNYSVAYEFLMYGAKRVLPYRQLLDPLDQRLGFEIDTHAHGF